MKVFCNTLICDLKRTFISLYFLTATIGLAFVKIITLFDEAPSFIPGETTIVYIYLIEQYLGFNIIYLLFAAIPGTILFCSDWDNRFIRFSVVRSSKMKYAISKVLACFTSGICVVFLAEWIMIAIFSFQFPLFDANFNHDVFASFATSDKIMLYFLVKSICKAFCAGFLCVFALWFSTKIINVFVALATPLLAYYFFNTLSIALGIPAWLIIGNLSECNININQDPVLSFLFPIVIFLISTMVFGFLFIRNCKRRIENG